MPLEDFEYEAESFRKTMKNLGTEKQFGPALERIESLAQKEPEQANRALRQLRKRMVSGFWDSGIGKRVNLLVVDDLSRSDALEETHIERLLQIAEEMYDKGILRVGRTYTLYSDLKWRFEKNKQDVAYLKELVKNLAVPLKRELMKIAREHDVRLNSIDQQVYMDKRKWAWKEGKKDGPSSDRSVDKLFTKFGSFFK